MAEAAKGTAAPSGAPTPAPLDAVLVERLLTLLAQGLYGAIEMGTLSLFWKDKGPDPRGFIEEKYAEPIRSLAGVLRLAFRARPEAERAAVAAVVMSAQSFLTSLFALEGFRHMNSQELRAAAEAFRKNAGDLRRLVGAVAEVVPCEVPYLQKMTGEREAYYTRILDHLYDLLAREQ